VAAVAADQWSQATTAQLRACGLSSRAVRRAVERGQLFGVYHGVYSVGRPLVSPYEWAMAAVLACGPGALLSHHWGAWNYGLRRLPDHPPDVTAPAGRHPRPNLTLHRCRSPLDGDCDRNHSIPTTSPARTLLDCAPSLPHKQLTRLVNDAQIKRLTTVEELRTIAGRSGRATKALRAQLPLDQHGATRSLLEDLLLGLHRERGFPQPLVNHLVEGIECDFSYPALRLVIEADGYAYHSTRSGFESDHEKRLALEAAGQRVVAVTYRQLTENRRRTGDQLARIMADRGRFR